MVSLRDLFWDRTRDKTNLHICHAWYGDEKLDQFIVTNYGLRPLPAYRLGLTFEKGGCYYQFEPAASGEQQYGQQRYHRLNFSKEEYRASFERTGKTANSQCSLNLLVDNSDRVLLFESKKMGNAFIRYVFETGNADVNWELEKQMIHKPSLSLEFWRKSLEERRQLKAMKKK